MYDSLTSVLCDVELKPEVWFIERKLAHRPPHFVSATTPINKESAQWIAHSLVGRYALESDCKIDNFFVELVMPSFEDPAEAVMYELKWS